MIAAELIERHLVFPKLVSRESVFEVPAGHSLIRLAWLRGAGRVNCIEPLQDPAPLSSGGTAGCDRKVAQLVVVAPFPEESRHLGLQSKFCGPLLGDQIIQPL